LRVRRFIRIPHITQQGVESSADKLAQQGILTKVFLPGRKRAIGFREEDVNRLLA